MYLPRSSDVDAQRTAVVAGFADLDDGRNAMNGLHGLQLGCLICMYTLYIRIRFWLILEDLWFDNMCYSVLIFNTNIQRSEHEILH